MVIAVPMGDVSAALHRKFPKGRILLRETGRYIRAEVVGAARSDVAVPLVDAARANGAETLAIHSGDAS